MVMGCLVYAEGAALSHVSVNANADVSFSGLEILLPTTGPPSLVRMYVGGPTPANSTFHAEANLSNLALGVQHLLKMPSVTLRYFKLEFVGRSGKYVNVPNVRLKTYLLVPAGASAAVTSNVGEGQPMKLELTLPNNPSMVMVLDTTLVTAMGGRVLQPTPFQYADVLDQANVVYASYETLPSGAAEFVLDLTVFEAISELSISKVSDEALPSSVATWVGDSPTGPWKEVVSTEWPPTSDPTECDTIPKIPLWNPIVQCTAFRVLRHQKRHPAGPQLNLHSERVPCDGADASDVASHKREDD
jgi:hypothetical protein